jgi:hypothetical protein
MDNTLRLFLFSAVLCLSAASSPAQQPPATNAQPNAQEHSEDRGLLLGLYFPIEPGWSDLQSEMWVSEISDEPHGQYLTLWVSKTGESVKIQAIKELLVPRNDGFWRMGSHLVKAAEQPESNYDEQFWAAPVAQQPDMSPSDPDINGRSVRMLTYVGGDHVSYYFHWEGGAGDWEYVFPGVTAIDAFAKNKTIEEVLGPTTSASYKRLAKSLNHMDEEPTEEPCRCCEGREDEWAIVHVGDHWQAFARFQYGSSSTCGQQSIDRVLATTLPKRLAPGGSLGRSWKASRAEVEATLKTGPDSIRHLFVSPKQDLIVALGTFGVAVLSVENLHPHSVLKIQEFDAPCIPVMEQWSLGRFVSAWDSVTQKQDPAQIPPAEAP